jgi:hypothetical protein
MKKKGQRRVEVVMKNRKGMGRGVEEGGKLVVRSGGNGGKAIRKHDLDVVQ